MEFQQLENSLQTEKLKQMRLTTCLSKKKLPFFVYVGLVVPENGAPFFSTSIFGKAAIMWYFHAASNTIKVIMDVTM